ncbi:hypothetical protein VRK_31020 [Vibrio sp. MEBiC08052]|nr:hypothetical protein VRK_31020 [Vibrio sp. MEBiC08052]
MNQSVATPESIVILVNKVIFKLNGFEIDAVLGKLADMIFE